ncbi:hypothetical protein ACGVWS_16035, partial [Enterobacteriaceae bacterium LUAb1]
SVLADQQPSGSWVNDSGIAGRCPPSPVADSMFLNNIPLRSPSPAGEDFRAVSQSPGTDFVRPGSPVLQPADRESSLSPFRPAVQRRLPGAGHYFCRAPDPAQFWADLVRLAYIWAPADGPLAVRLEIPRRLISRMVQETGYTPTRNAGDLPSPLRQHLRRAGLQSCASDKRGPLQALVKAPCPSDVAAWGIPRVLMLVGGRQHTIDLFQAQQLLRNPYIVSQTVMKRPYLSAD